MKLIMDASMWGESLKGLSSKDVKMFIAIGALSYGDGPVMASTSKLAEVSGMCKVSVAESLKSMKGIGMIDYHVLPGRNGGFSITINPDWARKEM